MPYVLLVVGSVLLALALYVPDRPRCSGAERVSFWTRSALFYSGGGMCIVAVSVIIGGLL